MNFYPLQFPAFLYRIFPKVIFRKETDEHIVYLTFDDGPTPKITDWVLKVLEEEQVQATFFCVGKNIENHPDLFQKIIDNGHRVANHSYKHRSGWDTTTNMYIKDILKTERIIEKFTPSKKLFRPPYGRLTPSQAMEIEKNKIQLVMWSVVSGDFSKNFNVEKAIWYLSSHSKPGEVIVFHDSEKAFNNLKEILRPIIHNLKKRGYQFGKL